MTLKDTIQQLEGRRLEFKEVIPTKAELEKTIVAFSNDAGGVLYLGVRNEPREAVGLPEANLMEIEEQVSNIIHDRCTPVIIPDISVVSIDDNYLLKVEIFRGNQPPYYLKASGKNKGTYIRVGSSNRLATPEIIAELERQRRNISFDSELIFDKALSDIDIANFKAFYKEKTGEKLDENSLKKLHLVAAHQDQMKATQALLFFSDDPLRKEIFPYAKIECGRFKGETMDQFIDQKTIDSNIALQAEAAYEFVLRHINRGAKVKGVYTETRWEYPITAIRETIRNSIVHRDYSLSGKDIKVAIYDDMIEITSPGTLLPSINFTEMESRQSDIRNKVIAPVFKKLGIIDQWGNGLKLIAEELKEYPEIEFKWFEKGLQFQVQFIKKNYVAPKPDKGFGFLVDEFGLDIDAIEKNLGERSLVILKMMFENSKITSIELAEVIDVSESTIKRDIKELTDKKYLDRKGSKKAGDWIIIKQK
ncbi:RNA-binding domain-containing protein [Ulvibacter litoralis]|uniref:Predicted transcriptional regulator, contains HTH domain n=1 Tax=Ulvibacter litoralis TaxID=227084 RepID=A0A1G7CPS0_9FLAO|nr:RNA-binding domain-containing protein [Ulvibacter litoralis]GHC46757.1 hypothetical protein GCM10008083_07280 [Ulvibacter litoralis]SDE40760.1 Predicted transcriptional regulator, contains HTH domain [Ulvibacter litoralis]